MYCVPNPLLYIAVYRPDGTEVETKPGTTKIEALRAYGVAWATWGPHPPPEAFCHAMRADESAATPLVVFIRERRLDQETSRMIEKQYRYKCGVN